MDHSRPGLLAGPLPLWLLRLLWAGSVVLVGSAIGQALASHSRPVQLVGTVGSWSGWFAGLVVVLVPTSSSLTVFRFLLPGAAAAAVLGATLGASATSATIAIAASLSMAMLGFSGEIGQRFVQGSAYGDETRLPLRPPGPLLIGPIPVLWALCAAGVMGGPLLVAARAWIGGTVLTVSGVALTILTVRSLHRLSCRWLVFVPAGLVLHDELVLAETAMFRFAEIASVSRALAGSEAADLTGDALGPAIELGLADASTVVLIGSRARPHGVALHVRSFLVSPTRPGRALDEARRRSLADRGPSDPQATAMPPPSTSVSDES
ncbi:MAG: hypothetical protein RJA49_3030 [Actinomycetota bacterium]